MSKKPLTQAFSAGLSKSSADAAQTYLSTADVLASEVRATIRSHLISAGKQGVDVGCGLGTATDDLTEHGFEVTGFDRSEHLIAEARRRFSASAFAVADACALPVADDSVDWYRAERLYLHLADPLAALREAARVVRRNGVIVLADTDFTSVRIRAGDDRMSLLLSESLASTMPQPDAGLRHRQWFDDMGFPATESSRTAVEMTDVELATTLFLSAARESLLHQRPDLASAVASWTSDLAEAASRGLFRLTFDFYVSAVRVAKSSDSR